MKLDPGMAGHLVDPQGRFGTRGPGLPDRVITRGEGAQVWDLKGNCYLDFTTGGIAHQGHTHVRIATAMVEQCLRLPFTAPGWRNDHLPPLREKLCLLAGFEAALILTTGAEAREAALGAARSWAHRSRGLEPARAQVLGFDAGPAQPGFRRLPFGNLAAATEAAGPDTCAILVEPIQTGGGLRLPPRGFLRGLRELCDARRILLLVDETGCGLGRTGKLFAFQHERIHPDGLILGEALSGGFYPVSGFLASREVAGGCLPPPMASPFGGGPLACAVASATLEVLVNERLAERSAELGAYFLARLGALDARAIREVRGLGLWAALQLTAPAARDLVQTLAKEGLLCGEALSDTLLLAPPLVITREELDLALEILEGSLGPGLD